MSSDNRNSGENTEGRNADGTFAKGNAGKPTGSRHRATQAIQGLMEAQKEALGAKAVELALEGDMAALRLCIERICPARKDSPVEFDLPQIKTVNDAAEAARTLLTAVGDGEITPLEGATVMGLIEQFRRTVAMSELECRLRKLESNA